MQRETNSKVAAHDSQRQDSRNTFEWFPVANSSYVVSCSASCFKLSSSVAFELQYNLC